MKDYQVRVVREFEALIEKITKLRKYLKTEFPIINDIIDLDESELLKFQLRAMDIYVSILADRIERWRFNGIQIVPIEDPDQYPFSTKIPDIDGRAWRDSYGEVEAMDFPHKKEVLGQMKILGESQHQEKVKAEFNAMFQFRMKYTPTSYQRELLGKKILLWAQGL